MKIINLIPFDNSTILAELETNSNKLELETMYELIECTCIDIKDVRQNFQELLGFEACLVFDDEFLCYNAPIINPIASLLFGYSYEHNEVLCGNVLIAKNAYNDEGEIETVCLTDEETKKVIELIDEMSKRISGIPFVKQAPRFEIYSM